MSTDTRQQIQALLRQRSVAGERLVRDPVSECPASEGQRALWFAQAVAQTPAYNIVTGFRIDGAFSVPAFQSALAFLADRHEIVRTQLVEEAGALVQRILPTVEIPLLVADLSQSDDSDGALRALVADECGRAFDLACAPLARAIVVKLHAESHVALAVMHHAMGDAWSQNVVATELGAAYARALRGDSSDVPPLPVQYSDFSRWQQAILRGAEGERQVAYWRQALDRLPLLHGLPTDRPRQSAIPAETGRVIRRLPTAPVLRLQEIARAANATVFHALLALYATAVARFGDTDDVTIGFASANRQRPELQGLIGYLVTALPARIALSDRATLHDTIAQVRSVVVGAMANQDVPLDVIVDRLGIARAPQIHPLFQLFFSYQEGGAQVLQLAQAKLSPLPADLLPRRAPKFDLSLVARRDEHGIELCWDYDVRLFDASSVETIADAIMQLATIGDPALPTATVALLPAERTEVQPLAKGLPHFLHDLVARHVASRPDCLAVVDSTHRWTYAELHRQSAHTAQVLALHGVAAGACVVVALRSGAPLVATMLAIWRRGAVFVPVDPEVPVSRLQQIIRGCAALCVVTDGVDTTGVPDGCATVDIRAGGFAQLREPASATIVTGDDVAYIVHTSGSTGVPKGVMIGHANLAFFIDAMTRRFPLAPGWTYGIATHPSTDIGLGNVFLALATGGTLHLIDRETSRDAAKYARYVQENPIDVAKFTPSHYLSLYQPGTFGTAQPRQMVILAGEALAPAIISSLADHFGKCRIVNSYGPSECSVSCCVHEIDAPVAGARVPIGMALPGVRLRVMGQGELSNRRVLSASW
ncbi:condensation domain-containing protein [Tahibacter amnicola]|uniref:Condensation domain-containing protein n=1 Tax=Tahibacter amnicola TaxID=2976241 RepID=A0ABY6B8T6_9GAMM|nr:condensation domain-containing protein [Tahibacter amnicola]UXI66285.1 condensation domain-containing protein [Tahibacter amnicola]